MQRQTSRTTSPEHSVPLSPPAGPSSEARIRVVGLATLVAGVLPVRIEPGVVVLPWSAEALSTGADLIQVLVPVLTGTALISISGLYGARQLRPPFGALLVFGLWAFTVGAVGSSPWMARTMVGGPFSRIDVSSLWVILSLAAAATGLEIRRMTPRLPSANRLLYLSLILLPGTYALPSADGLVAEDVVGAWRALFGMSWRPALAVLPFRLADLAPLAAAVALFWAARRTTSPWSFPMLLYGLATCVAAGGIPLLVLDGDVLGALAWLRSGLLCAAAVEGIQWSLVREAKAVASVEERRHLVATATAGIVLAATGIGFWLSRPTALEDVHWNSIPPGIDRAIMHVLPRAAGRAGELADADLRRFSSAFAGTEGIWEAVEPLLHAATPSPMSEGRWKRRAEKLNRAFRTAGYPYYAELTWTPETNDAPRRARIRVFRIERLYVHPTSSGPFEVVVGHTLDEVPDGELEVGRVHAGAISALVDSAAVSVQARRRALSLVADRSCGAGGFDPAAEASDEKCGQLLAAALTTEPHVEKRNALERTTEQLARALLRITVRHEMQHQLDVATYRIPLAVFEAAQNRPPSALVRLTLETSAQLAEYCSSSPLDHAVSVAEQLAHIWDRTDPSTDRLASILALELLTGVTLRSANDEVDAEAIERVLSVLATALPAELGREATQRHELLFGTPCATLTTPHSTTSSSPPIRGSVPAHP